MTRYIVAVDPGKITGLALFSFESGQEPVLEWSGEVEFADFVFEIRKMFELYGDSLEVICEKFTINTQTAKKAQAPYSLEVIGSLKTTLLDNERDPEGLMYQQPADAMAMFTNEKLKKLEYWHRGGAGHALDAIRHGLLRLVKTGWIPTKLLK